MAPPSTSSGTVLSLNTHRRYTSVESYVKALGGDKQNVIEKVLIANNGIAAVKAIRSMRKWAYEVFGDERAIVFVVMATPEDLRANAEFIRMGDIVVDVPGGTNNHNFANVRLIVELARLHGVQAVWAGWGHASENPLLPDSLKNSNPPIKFIGPAGPPMRALGDKIGSTIIAQSAGVPCISWNGSHINSKYDIATGTLPQDDYDAANITNVDQAVEASSKVGFPVMVKASEGGGGKGIRRVDRIEDVPTAYRQVSSEVPGSPIFIMKLSDNSRHLEVQVIADEYGNAIALNGRDCSVQRRHQKIIEEGPPVAAPSDVWVEMEKAAVSLAKAVGYANAGTVEYLFSEPDQKFYFLELNPRLQVEHPVTEMITKVNLPAAQLQVAMGIPLYNIPEIRELYGRNRFEDDGNTPESVIDFDSERFQTHGHCIAVRITAENAEAGFKPTSGGIQELNFRSTPSVWGYFSMDSSGSIHEFADSQFGHLFANGVDREQARRNMVLALKEISIRGEIATTVDYISHLIEMEDYVENRINTGWLDAIIKKNVDGMAGGAEAAGLGEHSAKSNRSVNDHTSIVVAATVSTLRKCVEGENQFIESLKKGQLPPLSLLSMSHDIELILEGTKYKLKCTRSGPHNFSIFVEGDDSNRLEVNARKLSDGGYLVVLEGKSHVGYVTSDYNAATGMRMNIGGSNVVFSPDYDPTRLRTDVAGKLVKRLVPEGAHVKKGDIYCEIEVMKMIMPLKVEENGTLTWAVNEGASLAPGDVLASLALDNPDSVKTASVFEGKVELSRPQSIQGSKSRPHILLRNAADTLRNGLAGYVLSSGTLKQAIEDLDDAVRDVALPVFEIEEQLSVLSGRIDSSLFEKISTLIRNFKEKHESNPLDAERFPAELIDEALNEYAASVNDSHEKATFVAATSLLKETVAPYTRNKDGFPGSERALLGFINALRQWISVERWFCDGASYADAIDSLRQAHKDDYDTVLNICRAHAQLKSTASLVSKVIKSIGDGGIGRPRQSTSVVAGAESLRTVLPCLSEIGALGGNEIYASVSLNARRLLVQESIPSKMERQAKLTDFVRSISPEEKTEMSQFLHDDLPFADVLMPVLKGSSSGKDSQVLLELYARKLYRNVFIKDVQFDSDITALKLTFSSKGNRIASIRSKSLLGGGTSMTDLTKVVNSSASLSELESEETDEGSLTSLQLRRGTAIPANTERNALFIVLPDLDSIKAGSSSFLESVLKTIPQFVKEASKCSAGPINVIHFIVTEDTYGLLYDDLAALFQDFVSRFRASFEEADVRRISFIVANEDEGCEAKELHRMPAIFTYRATLDFQEDTLFRNIEPDYAYHLDLLRLSKNFHVKTLASSQTSTCNTHVYEASPKAAALEKDKNASKEARIFVRVLSFTKTLTSENYEKVFVDSLNALDVNRSSTKFQDNHMFINFVSDEKNVVDPAEIEKGLMEVVKRHSDRIRRLGLKEVETRVECRLTNDTHPISLRLVASNPTGYVHVLNTYVEAADDTKKIFRLIGGTKGALAGSGDSSWEGMDITTPYPLTRPFEAQRRAASKASDTLYCYDLPALFETAVESKWDDACKLNNEVSRPMMVTYTTELVVQKKVLPEDDWTMDDYFEGKLEMVPMQRGAGMNNVGMVAWLMTLKTFEYPEGRQVVLISNDITVKAGSFGTREDVVFKLASEFARERKLPRLYIAANSGARIGTAEGVKNAYKVCFKNEKNPENGFHYLYIDEGTYQSLGNKGILHAEPTLDSKGKKVYKITDIIGSEPDLGVENLKGSGLIAGETSAAYNDVFTLTIVMGRSVGIGAYLVRLGQRTIQKSANSPIILTGYQALNKLMGVEVYSTNDQLGGPGIMYNNGVSHLVAADHLRAVEQAVDWLSFVPSTRGGMLPITDIRGSDIVERKIDFSPSPGIAYDPRMLLAGGQGEDGEWQSGFFDKGSFIETLGGWAKSVVVGRARLGGIPMGVIVTENRVTELVKPADPADVSASESIIQQPGCVWFPNSAFKTAQAIKDFHTEDLPLMIFANWRGFSGGQRDMFDEVLKYGSFIVDAFVAYEQPIFVFIPPFAEIRGGAWVVVDSSINSSVMEMYAAAKTARGGILEANGTATVKYRAKDLVKTMHRLDDKLIALKSKLLSEGTELTASERCQVENAIKERECMLLPVYEQIAVKFCELHDTPGRMKATGVIEKEVEWEHARTFFYWRLRRKLAEFDLRKKFADASSVGSLTPRLSLLEATNEIKKTFVEDSDNDEAIATAMWQDDKAVLSWMGTSYASLEAKIDKLRQKSIASEVQAVLIHGGENGKQGIVEGIAQALLEMDENERELFKIMIKDSLNFLKDFFIIWHHNLKYSVVEE